MTPFGTRSWCRGPGQSAAFGMALADHGSAFGADQVGETGRLAAFGLRALGGLPQQRRQDRGLAVVEVPGRGEQRHGPARRRERAQPAERRPLRAPGELTKVTLAELRELGRVVSVPGAQFGGRGGVLGPVVQPDGVFAHAARPDPVDEYAGTVRGRRLIVDAADPDIERRNRPHPHGRVVTCAALPRRSYPRFRATLPPSGWPARPPHPGRAVGRGPAPRSARRAPGSRRVL